MVELSERTADAMETNFSNLFFDVMTGEFKGLADFATGVLGGFREALEGQNQRPECRALVRQQDPELNAFYERRHPRVSSRSGGRLQLNHDLVNAGKDAGRQLRIRPGVDGSGAAGGRLLHE